MTFFHRLFVDCFCEVLVRVNVAGASRLLYFRDVQWRPSVFFTVTTPVNGTGSFKFDNRQGLSFLAIAKVVATDGFFGQHVETNTFDAAGRSGKRLVDDIRIQSDRFKDAGTFVTGKS